MKLSPIKIGLVSIVAIASNLLNFSSVQAQSSELRRCVQNYQRELNVSADAALNACLQQQQDNQSAPIQPEECISRYGQTACGYNCVAAYGKVACASTPNAQCISGYGQIACGYGCAKGYGEVNCSSRPTGRCQAAYGRVTCSSLLERKKIANEIELVPLGMFAKL